MGIQKRMAQRMGMPNERRNYVLQNYEHRLLAALASMLPGPSEFRLRACFW